MIKVGPQVLVWVPHMFIIPIIDVDKLTKLHLSRYANDAKVTSIICNVNGSIKIQKDID